MTRRPKLTLAYQVLSGLVCSVFFSGTSSAIELPQRQSAVPETTNSVPHIQLDVTPNPVLNEALVDRITDLPGVYTENTANSLAGARGFRLRSDVNVSKPQRLLGGREFAHLHADGSLHAFLPPKLAQHAIEQEWGTWHPWARQNPGWDGFIMIYTPSTDAELNVVISLVTRSYEFVTGQTVASASSQTAIGDAL